MIKRKKKTCKRCRKQKYIFGHGLCQGCYNFSKSLEYAKNKPKPKPIKRISSRHRQAMQEYGPKRKRFLEDHPVCMAHLQGCTLKATDVHHLRGRDTKERLLNANEWLAVCRNCHNIIEGMGKQVYELRLKLRRF